MLPLTWPCMYTMSPLFVHHVGLCVLLFALPMHAIRLTKFSLQTLYPEVLQLLPQQISAPQVDSCHSPASMLFA